MGAKSNTSKHQILKLTCISENCTFEVGDFSFFTQIPRFSYQKIQIKVPSTKSNFLKCEGLHENHFGEKNSSFNCKTLLVCSS